MQPTAPYFRQGMMERLNAIPTVTAVFPCGEEEIAYTGVMTTALHTILRGHRRKDDDEVVPVRLPTGDLLLFDVVNAIKRQVTAGAIPFKCFRFRRGCDVWPQRCLSSTGATPAAIPSWRARTASTTLCCGACQRRAIRRGTSSRIFTRATRASRAFLGLQSAACITRCILAASK